MTISSYPHFSLELGPEIANLKCSDCGCRIHSVHGYIKRKDWAYSVYFATIQSGHEAIAMNLTVSIGKFWDGTDPSQRSWVYMIVWPSESGSGYEIKISNPDGSRHDGSKLIGKKLSEEDAKQSPLLEEFFEVAHFVLDNDPAVRSYLAGEKLNYEGRIVKN
jgi:hypothetical protein